MTQTEIQKTIDEDINPALQMHGGYITIHEFDEKTKLLKLKMGGGCQGCSSATATLQMQVEHLLMELFPDLSAIEDVTNHLAGENPYYQ